jgi:hypothetical protein
MMTSSRSKKKDQENAKEVIRQLAKKWPSSFVARSEIAKFSGGLIAPGTAANNDSLGVGIPGAFRVKKKIAYPVNSAIDWLIDRLEVQR